MRTAFWGCQQVGRRERERHTRRNTGEKEEDKDPKIQVSESQGWKRFQGGPVTFIRLLGSQGGKDGTEVLKWP